MMRYGNVNGFIYCARQKEQPKQETVQEDECPEYVAEKSNEVKVCGSCGRELPVECFWRNKAQPDGRSGYCKGCSYERERYRKERAKRITDREERATLSEREKE